MSSRERKHRNEILLGANPNSSHCKYHSSKMQSATFQQGNSGVVLVTDKHIIIVTLASEWGFAVHKVCPLILSLQPSPQPWRSWGDHHYQHGKHTRQVLFQELYSISQRFINEGTEQTKQPDQAPGATRGRTRHGTLASGPASGSCLLEFVSSILLIH